MILEMMNQGAHLVEEEEEMVGEMEVLSTITLTLAALIATLVVKVSALHARDLVP